jgi:hypothetical protein
MKTKKTGLTIHELVIHTAIVSSFGIAAILLGFSGDLTDVEASARVDSVEAEDCPVSLQFPAKVRQWCDLISKFANQYNLDPDLIAAVIWLESGGNPVAYSHSGAVGLMQVMPRDGIASTFMCASGPCFANRPSRSELEDPEFNISYGTRMLANLYQRTGSLREALKSYGPMDVNYSYADRVLSIFQRYNSN